MSSAKLAFLVFFAIAVIRICSANKDERHVYIKNDLPYGLVLSFHCLSKDDDLGSKLLAPGEEWGFGFRLNIFGTTLFHCGFEWAGSKTYLFSVYTDNHPWYPCENCHWSVRINGTCLSRSSIELLGCYDWVA